MIDATELLDDLEGQRILLATYNSSKTVSEMSMMYGIPIARCHAKVRRLVKMGLLKPHGMVLSKRGKVIEAYTAELDNAYAFFENGRLKVRFIVALNLAQDFKRRWERNVGISHTVHA